VNRFSRQCGSLDVSQSNVPSRPVTGVALPLRFFPCRDSNSDPSVVQHVASRYTDCVPRLPSNLIRTQFPLPPSLPPTVSLPQLVAAIYKVVLTLCLCHYERYCDVVLSSCFLHAFYARVKENNDKMKRFRYVHTTVSLLNS
jgi:hypothetical protein